MFLNHLIVAQMPVDSELRHPLHGNFARACLLQSYGGIMLRGCWQGIRILWKRRCSIDPFSTFVRLANGHKPYMYQLAVVQLMLEQAAYEVRRKDIKKWLRGLHFLEVEVLRSEYRVLVNGYEFCVRGSFDWLQMYAREKDCGHCRKTHVKNRCGRCRRVRYCDEYCQKADWAQHQVTCTP